MQRQAYPGDLPDGQREVVLSLMPAAKNGRTGRPRKYPLREIWNASTYIARTGCSGRQLPHDFPPWGDVRQHFRRWRNAGVIDGVHDALRDQTRKNSKREGVIRKQPGQKTLKALPRRRVVERTSAWLMKYRRPRADYENTVSSSRAWILLAMTSLTARRLRPA